MSSSSKEKKKPFHNEESNLPSYPSCTGTLGTVSHQKTKVVQKKSSFHREQEDLSVGWGRNNALSHGALDLSQTIANQRGRATQKDLEEERKMKAEKKPKMRPYPTSREVRKEGGGGEG
ncbi:uncharacterized protein RSE6_10980 [Rhynchosporium secalis]|uniref:Uncharacterized protein n=1 Tax=Rhynchosporium secalis TaxID=38038 RepID=A0A1E1MLV7_RHYSE|nr:uncharacterized protein RSE6_10980 [Rhynchosporium secalis]